MNLLQLAALHLRNVADVFSVHPQLDVLPVLLGEIDHLETVAWITHLRSSPNLLLLWRLGLVRKSIQGIGAEGTDRLVQALVGVLENRRPVHAAGKCEQSERRGKANKHVDS